MASQEIDKLIKLRDAADRLGLSMGGIRGWVLLRKIEFVKRGRNVMIKRAHHPGDYFARHGAGERAINEANWRRILSYRSAHLEAHDDFSSNYCVAASAETRHSKVFAKIFAQRTQNREGISSDSLCGNVCAP